jgi:hypothetical protein
MSLPIQTAPVYTLTIPSTKKVLKYRPFLVREEKALLIAQMTNDVDVMLNTLKSVIESCAITKIDSEKLASFDFEYIFSQLRAVSVGETVTLTIRCDTCDDERAKSLVEINLKELNVEIPKEFTNKINLYDNVGVIMKYPTVRDITNAQMNRDNIDDMFKTVSNCIESIYNEDELFNTTEQSTEEIIKFLDSLKGEQFKKIEDYFDSLPKLSKEVNYTCPVCKKEHTRTVAGLANFF